MHGEKINTLDTSKVTHQGIKIFFHILFPQTSMLRIRAFFQAIWNMQISNQFIKNYRPVCILPNSSKIFERCLHDQLTDYSDRILSKDQCRFRKGFSTQHFLLAMTEKVRKSLESRGASAALLTDLLKVFDCLPHDLLIPEVNACDINEGSLYSLFSYLKNRKKKKRVYLNNTYSE